RHLDRTQRQPPPTRHGLEVLALRPQQTREVCYQLRCTPVRARGLPASRRWTGAKRWTDPRRGHEHPSTGEVEISPGVKTQVNQSCYRHFAKVALERMSPTPRLTTTTTALLVVDIQERLLPAMFESDRVLQNSIR